MIVTKIYIALFRPHYSEVYPSTTWPKTDNFDVAMKRILQVQKEENIASSPFQSEE